MIHQRKIVNKKLPIIPWMDRNLSRLPGTLPLSEAPLFVKCDKYKEQLKLRDKLVSSISKTVCMAQNGTEVVLDECIDWIKAKLKLSSDYVVEKNYLIRPDNVKIWYNGQPKMETIARIIQEDILIHKKDPVVEKFQLIAGALCFPSHWTLSQKLGMNLKRIHKPVPEYSGDIANRVERLFFGLRPNCSIWRANWTVKNSPILHIPLMEGDVLPNKFSLDKEWWIRVEKQTFSKLPSSGAVIFGIHTYVASPASLKKEQLDTLLEKLQFKNLIHH